MANNFSKNNENGDNVRDQVESDTTKDNKDLILEQLKSELKTKYDQFMKSDFIQELASLVKTSNQSNEKSETFYRDSEKLYLGAIDDINAVYNELNQAIDDINAVYNELNHDIKKFTEYIQKTITQLKRIKDLIQNQQKNDEELSNNLKIKTTQEGQNSQLHKVVATTILHTKIPEFSFSDNIIWNNKKAESTTKSLENNNHILLESLENHKSILNSHIELFNNAKTLNNKYNNNKITDSYLKYIDYIIALSRFEISPDKNQSNIIFSKRNIFFNNNDLFNDSENKNNIQKIKINNDHIYIEKDEIEKKLRSVDPKVIEKYAKFCYDKHVVIAKINLDTTSKRSDDTNIDNAKDKEIDEKIKSLKNEINKIDNKISELKTIIDKESTEVAQLLTKEEEENRIKQEEENRVKQEEKNKAFKLAMYKKAKEQILTEQKEEEKKRTEKQEEEEKKREAEEKRICIEQEKNIKLLEDQLAQAKDEETKATIASEINALQHNLDKSKWQISHQKNKKNKITNNDYSRMLNNPKPNNNTKKPIFINQEKNQNTLDFKQLGFSKSTNTTSQPNQNPMFISSQEAEQLSNFNYTKKNKTDFNQQKNRESQVIQGNNWSNNSYTNNYNYVYNGSGSNQDNKPRIFVSLQDTAEQLDDNSLAKLNANATLTNFQSPEELSKDQSHIPALINYQNGNGPLWDTKSKSTNDSSECAGGVLFTYDVALLLARVFPEYTPVCYGDPAYLHHCIKETTNTMSIIPVKHVIDIKQPFFINDGKTTFFPLNDEYPSGFVGEPNWEPKIQGSNEFLGGVVWTLEIQENLAKINNCYQVSYFYDNTRYIKHCLEYKEGSLSRVPLYYDNNNNNILFDYKNKEPIPTLFCLDFDNQLDKKKEPILSQSKLNNNDLKVEDLEDDPNDSPPTIEQIEKLRHSESIPDINLDNFPESNNDKGGLCLTEELLKTISNQYPGYKPTGYTFTKNGETKQYITQYVKTTNDTTHYFNLDRSGFPGTAISEATQSNIQNVNHHQQYQLLKTKKSNLSGQQSKLKKTSKLKWNTTYYTKSNLAPISEIDSSHKDESYFI